MFASSMILVIVASLAHIGFMRQPRNVASILAIVLKYAFIFIVAFSGFIAFLGHTFRADYVAQQIGWPTGNPFQSEVAVANLAFGVLGILTIWLRGTFWLATAISYAVFMTGAGVVHIHQLVVAGNRAPLNAGATILAADLIVPLILLVLAVVHWRLTGDGRRI